MINPREDGGETPFDIMYYHVIDKNGKHRFLTINSLSNWFSEGREGFERVLVKQYKTFELVGSIHASMTMTDPLRVKVPDDLGGWQLLERIIDLMKALPNSSDRLETWTPYPGKIVELWPGEPGMPHWRPMSELGPAMGNVDPEEIPFVFTDVDVCEVVKPEFIDTARARGGALLREFKEDARRIAEPQILRAIEGRAEDSNRQDGPTDPDVWERGVTLTRELDEAARKVTKLRFSQAKKGPAEAPDRQGGPAGLDEGER